MEDVLTFDAGSVVGAVVKGPKCKNTYKLKPCGGESYEVIRQMAFPLVHAECTQCKCEDYIVPVKG